MAWLAELNEILALRPVVVWLATAMVALRLLLVFSLRNRRRLIARRAVPATPSFREGVLEWLDSGLLAVLLLFLVIRPFIAQVMDVTSVSMAPTLQGSRTPQIDGPNDRVLVTRYLLHLRPPERGEVVVFAPTPEMSERREPVVKRLLGLPGDVVEIDATGRLLVNGQAAQEPYLEEVSDLPFPRREVPAHSYFVLGDNRNHSDDSARWGGNPFVPANRLRGKVLAICWPPDRWRLMR
ncbi:MAG: signal peptidase I [Armatimonadetes bacterium]|nr:signal peptidase I [Armatimonadota bacterium]